MTFLSQDFRLFGIDLRSGVQGVATLWDQMLRRPPFTWLYTPARVALLRVDGSVQQWQDGRQIPMVQPQGGKPVASPVFHAAEIDDAVVLRHSVTMPVMPLSQISDALALEVQTISPFAPDKLVWGWQLRPGTQGMLQLDIALASRMHIEQVLPAAAQTLGVDASGIEIWVLPLPSVAAAGVQQAPIVLQGFGESARSHDTLRRQRRVYGLLVLSACLVAMIAVTPTAQLWLRVRGANAALAEVQQRTQPAVAVRERFGQSAEKLKNLEIAMGESAAPLKVLALLTGALQDDSFVQTVQIDGAKVSIAGLTDNAAALMARLAATPGVLALRAPQAATRQAGATKETFGIEFQLEVAGLPARAADSPGAAPAPAPSAAGPAQQVMNAAPPGAELIYPRGPTAPSGPTMPAGPPPASLYSNLAPAEQTPAPVAPPPPPSAEGAPRQSTASIGGSAPAPVVPPAPAPAP